MPATQCNDSVVQISNSIVLPLRLRSINLQDAAKNLWLQFTAARPYFSGPPVLQDIVCLGSRTSQFQQVLRVIHLPWRKFEVNRETGKLQGPTLQDMEVYAKLGVDVSLEYIYIYTYIYDNMN